MHFYVTISPRRTQNCKTNFIIIIILRLFFKVAKNLPAPENFRRHWEVQKRHSGALAPLLETLRTHHRRHPRALFILNNFEHIDDRKNSRQKKHFLQIREKWFVQFTYSYILFLEYGKKLISMENLHLIYIKYHRRIKALLP